MKFLVLLFLFSLALPAVFSTAKGWKGCYFKSSTQWADNSLSGRLQTLVKAQTDVGPSCKSLNDFKARFQQSIQSNEYFGALWSGVITAPRTETFNFFARGDDGIRLLVDGRLAIGNEAWVAQGPTEYKTTVSFTAGQQYQITMQYFQLQGDATADLSWASATMPRVTLPESVVTPYEGDLSTTVNFQGNRFALLDGTDPTLLPEKNSQTQWRVLPPGWNLCAQGRLPQVVSANWEWGTDQVLGQGACFRTSKVGTCNNGQVIETKVENGKKLFRVNLPQNQQQTNYKILLQTAGRSVDVDASVPRIKQSVVFKGKEFAVLDGTLPTVVPKNDGLNQFFVIPKGWKIANKTPQTLTVCSGPRFRFGASQVVLADGSAMTTNNKRTTGYGKLEMFSTENGVSYVRPVEDTSTSTTTTTTTTTTTEETKILIERDSQAATSWSFAITPSNFVTFRRGESVIIYSVMDNVGATSTANGCQGVAMQIPDGWTPAQRTSEFESEVLNRLRVTFGTECLVFGDGTGLLTQLSPSKNDRFCGNNLLVQNNVDGKDFLAVTDCNVNRRILIQQTLSLNQLTPQSACGICKSWGDPHIEPFGSPRFTLLREGEYVYIKPIPTENQDYIIYHKHNPFGGVSVNGAVYIQFREETVSFSIDLNNGQISVARNGRTISNVNAEPVQTGSTFITQVNNEFRALLPNGILAAIKPDNWNGAKFFDVTYTVPNSLREKTYGICGYCGGKFQNLLVTPDGRTTDGNLNNDQQQSFGDSWKYTRSQAVTAKRQAPEEEGEETSSEETEKEESSSYDPSKGANSGTTTTKTTKITNKDGSVTTTTTKTTTKGGFTSTSTESRTETTVGLAPISTFNESPLELCKNEQFAAMAKRVCEGVSDKSCKDSCFMDVCISGNLGAALNAKRMEAVALAFDLNGGEGETCHEVAINNTLEFQGLTYAVLDNTKPDTKGSFGQSEYIRLPEGWEIAEDTPITRAFLSCANFGTTCFSLDNGIALSRDLHKCTTDAAIDTLPGNCYKPRGKARILIVKKALKGLIPDASINFQEGWEKVGEGYTLSTDTLSSNPVSKALQLTIVDKETRGAKITVNYNSKQRFNIGAWSKPLTPQSAPAGSSYSLTVELVDESGNSTLAGTVQFNSTNPKYHLRSVDVVPKAVVKSVIVTLQISGFEKIDALFSDLTIRSTSKFLGGNLVKDATIQTGSSAWKSLSKSGFSFCYVNDNTAVDGSGSIKLNSSSTGTIVGAYQDIVLTAEQKKDLKGIYFRGDSKNVNARGFPANGYALYLDIFYEDGTTTTGILAPFKAGQFGQWQSAQRVFKVPVKKTVKKITFAVTLKKHTGLAYFDNLYLTLIGCDGLDVNTADRGAGSFGGSHLVTFDGQKYTNHHVGDFVLFQDGKLNVFTRHVKQGDVSVVGAVLLLVNGTKIQIERSQGNNLPFVAINDQPKQLLNKKLDISNLGCLTVSGKLDADSQQILTLDFPATEHKVTVSVHASSSGSQFLQVIPKLPTYRLTGSRGLLGNADLKLSLRDSSDNTVQLKTQQTVDSFISSWKFKKAGFACFNSQNWITNSEPIPEKKTLTHYSTTSVQKALASCGDIFHKEECALDYLGSGDQGFVAAAATSEGTENGPQTQNPPITQSSSSDDSKTKLIIILTTTIGGVALLALVAVVVAFVVIRKRRNSAQGAPVLMS